MQQFGTSMFHTTVRRHKLCEMVNEFTLRNSVTLAIFVPKIIKIGENYTKLRQK